jgi:anti-sigma factor RsiW
MNCRDIEPLVTAYVDAAGTSADRAAVETHLDQCEACRADAERQAAARAVVRRRASVLASPSAPAALRARCANAAAPAPPARGVLPWAVAAALLAAVVLLITFTTRSTTLLAAQLTVDHVKCFEFAGKANPDAHALEASLASRFGWHIVVPPGSVAAGLTLLTARRCLYADGKVAHLMYRHRDRDVSLFVLPHTSRTPDNVEEVKVMGHEAVIWSSRQQSYVLIGREPRAELEQLAAYVQQTLAQDKPW